MATRSYTKIARAAAEEQTRTALLDAAEAAFFSGRPEELTLAGIARAAGTTKQTLLRHFGSKEGLLEAGFERGTAAVVAQRMAIPAGDIEAAVDNLLDHYEEFGDRALRLEAMEGHAAFSEFLTGGRALHQAWVDHAFGPLLAGAPDAGAVRAVLVALCDVHAWRILTRDLELSRAQARDAMILSIRRLLKEPA